MKTLRELSEDLGAGRTTSRALVEGGPGRDPAGEGARVFIALDVEIVRAAADAANARRGAGKALSALDGIPISIKDLFDVAGEVTGAGARIFAQSPPATEDCPVVARLRAAGLVFMGRTNMTEFAYSGLGINPHFDTPRNPFEREVGASPAARHRAPRSPSPTAWRRPAWARTPAAPAAFPPRSAASPAISRRRAACRSRA